MKRRRCAVLAVVGLLTMVSGSPSALAWFTVAEQADTKLEVELRTMTWLVSAEPGSNADVDERIRDFVIRRFRVVVRGRSSKSLSFGLQLGQDNLGGKLLADDGNVRIKEAFLNYQATTAFQVMVGQFKIPFLRHNLESGFNQLLVDRAALPTQRPAREGSRDVGLMLWGNRGGLQYRLAAFDGADQEVKNPGSNLRLAGRLAWNPFEPETDAGYSGTGLGKKRVLQLAAQFDAQADRLDARDDRDFSSLPREYRNWAIEAFWEQPLSAGSALVVEAAWLDRRDDYGSPDVTLRKLDGYYAQAGFLLPGSVGPGQLELALRHEQYTSERGTLRSQKEVTALGVNWYFAGHARKLQADYAFKRETPRVDDDELRLSLVATF